MHRQLTLVRTVYTPAQMILPEGPQVALAGRSNVGKSTLVNALAGRKSLAKVSATPGKTRSLNFYRVDPGGWFLVDLPGYGYARQSKAERDAWARLIETYLQASSGLRGVAVLLDCRLPPQAIDLELTAYLRQTGTPTLGVLTKADKCDQRGRANRQREWGGLLGGQPPVVFSARTGLGREALWTRLEELVQTDLDVAASRSPATAATTALASQAAGTGGRAPDSPAADPKANRA